MESSFAVGTFVFSLINLLIILLCIGFVLFFFISVIRYMKEKSRFNQALLQKLDRLLDLYEKKQN